jgi:hypothetical protein
VDGFGAKRRQPVAQEKNLKKLFAVFCLAKHGFFVELVAQPVAQFPWGISPILTLREENMKATTTAKPEDVERCASIWFLRLETARHHGNRGAEREARARLKSMGVTVRFRSAVTQ